MIKGLKDMKRRGNQRSMRTMLARALSFSAITAFTLNPVATPVLAADYGAPAPVAGEGQLNARFL
jgi:pilus assembly protein CpaC